MTIESLRNIPVLHVNTAKTWRGGEKQTFYLMERLISRGYKSVCVCQEDSVLHRRLVDAGLPCEAIRMRSGFDIFAARRIAGLAQKTGAGILHMHTSHAHSLGLLSALFYRVPVKIVARRVDFRVKGHLLNRLKYYFPDKYITVSTAIKDILIEDGIPEEKISAVHSGVDPADYDDIKTDYLYSEFDRISGSRDKIKFVNTAALTEQKDHETLINAMSLIVKSRRDVVLFILGKGELEKKLRRQVSSLGLGGHVFFTGYREDPLSFIKFGDIFVLSSRWEGLGTSIIDAMALGRPPVVCRTGGTPEIIDHGRNGLLVERENPQAFARAVLSLANDRVMRRKLGEAAILRAGDFSIESTIDGTLRVYEECLINLKAL